MIKRFVTEESADPGGVRTAHSLIAMVVIAVLTVMGKRISNTFNESINGLAT